MNRGTSLLGWIVLLAVPAICRADLLTGSVTYDPHTQLYTYSYTATDTGSSNSWLQEFDIRVGPAPAAPTAATLDNPARPVATNAPAGWVFNATVQPAGGYLGAGTYWSWFYPASIAPGASAAGFSFTTTAAPAVMSAGGTNYYGGFELMNGIVSLNLGYDGQPGQVVAPAVGTAQLAGLTAPEPSALLLGVSALLALAARVRRRVI